MAYVPFSAPLTLICFFVSLRFKQCEIWKEMSYIAVDNFEKEYFSVLLYKVIDENSVAFPIIK